MSTIQKFANDVAADMAQHDPIKKYAIDPFTITVIITIISELIKLYQNCHKTPAATAANMQDPGLIERWRLRRVIRKHVDDEEVHNTLGTKLFQSTLNVAKKVKEEDVKSMFAEVV